MAELGKDAWHWRIPGWIPTVGGILLSAGALIFQIGEWKASDDLNFINIKERLTRMEDKMDHVEYQHQLMLRNMPSDPPPLSLVPKKPAPKAQIFPEGELGAKAQPQQDAIFQMQYQRR